MICTTIVYYYKLLKDEKFRVKITIGEDKLPYHKDTSSPAVDLLVTKILLNSTISNEKGEPDLYAWILRIISL